MPSVLPDLYIFLGQRAGRHLKRQRGGSAAVVEIIAN
jgi:hypothetical protein